MERMTEWDEFGNADIIALSDVVQEIYAELSFGETNDLTDALNRLAAYEDTGLEPGEVSEYKHLCDSYVEAGLDSKFVQFCIDATQNGLSIDRICELAKAERDGRLVVLQGGATVHYLQEEYRKAKCMADERLPSPDYTSGSISGLGAGVIYILDKILTREEAEAALKKREETLE